MKFKTNIIGLSALLMTVPLITHADIRFNGFASIRATIADSDGSQSPFSTLKGNGDISFKDESLFALQASADLGEGLSATAQFMAEGTNDFDVEARWAYLSYDLDDTHRLSAGRFANPIFFQSEYEKVGYAHNYARLPKSVYIGFDFSTIEGIAIDSSFYLSDYTLETKVLYGSWNGSLFLNATNSEQTLGIKDIISVRGTLSGDWWKVFAGGFITELDGGSLDTVITDVFAAPGVAAAQGLGATEADINNFYDAVTWTGKDGIYWYAGFNIEYENWIIDYEYADYGVQDSSGAQNAASYLAVGYRFDKMVLTLHAEEYEQLRDYSFLSSVQHPVLIATGDGIHEALSSREFDGMGITLRYDFHDSATLKMDYFSGEDNRAVVGDYSILSVGVDLVF
jgi:hypothetical protein